MFNPLQFLLPQALISEDDELYADCAKEGVNLVDRVNGKPVAVYHYSIDRPNANWHSPKEEESDCFDDSDDSEEEDEPKKWWKL
jgi:hypothetical protein